MSKEADNVANGGMFAYRKLDVYANSKKYVAEIYRLLQKFPNEERFAMCNQLRRAAVSITSNIAEGMGRMAIKERLHFLEISYASITEVLCQLDISQSLGYISEENLSQAEEIAERLTRVMSGLRKSLLERITQ